MAVADLDGKGSYRPIITGAAWLGAAAALAAATWLRTRRRRTATPHPSTNTTP